MEIHGLIDKYLEFQDRIFYHHGREAVAIFVVLAALLFIFLWYQSTGIWSPAASAKKTQAALEQKSAGLAAEAGIVGDSFVCGGGRSIRARFAETQAELRLSDGRGLALPQIGYGALSKYSSPDGSFIFLTNGKTAFLSENGVATYVNCVANK